jgi:hypothetical protein
VTPEIDVTSYILRYLGYARCDLGVTMGLGLAFCAIGQELADAGRWDPTSDEVEQLFEETARAKVLAANVVRIMSDLRWVCFLMVIETLVVEMLLRSSLPPWMPITDGGF